MREISTQQKTSLKDLAEKYNLKLVILFGSHREGKTHKHSDYDIAVLSRKPKELRGQLGEFIGACARVAY